MTLYEGIIGETYIVCGNTLPKGLKRRMAALGMTMHAPVQLVHKKKSGTAVILLRGTRFAVGKGIISRIEVSPIQERISS